MNKLLLGLMGSALFLIVSCGGSGSGGASELAASTSFNLACPSAEEAQKAALSVNGSTSLTNTSNEGWTAEWQGHCDVQSWLAVSIVNGKATCWYSWKEDWETGGCDNTFILTQTGVKGADSNFEKCGATSPSTAYNGPDACCGSGGGIRPGLDYTDIKEPSGCRMSK